MNADAITVVIPTVIPRRHRLAKALASIGNQDRMPHAVIIRDDIHGDGAPITRNTALMDVTTPWVAFLDDDDWFYPQHLHVLFTTAVAYEADYVWSWFDLIDNNGVIRNENDPLTHYGKQWDDNAPTQTTITTLVRTDIAQSVGFTRPDESGVIDGQRSGEDFAFTLGCRAAGAVFRHVPERTWAWHHTGYNLSGRSWKQPDMLAIAMADPAARVSM